MGTFRGTIHELSMAPGMVEDEESVYDDTQSSIDTGAATKGSDPISPAVIGMNSDAAHSTVIIKPIRTQEAEPEEPSGTGLSYAYYSKNLRLIYLTGAPPAYSGSVRSTRRSSYAARTSVDGAGTILSPAEMS